MLIPRDFHLANDSSGWEKTPMGKKPFRKRLPLTAWLRFCSVRSEAETMTLGDEAGCGTHAVRRARQKRDVNPVIVFIQMLTCSDDAVQDVVSPGERYKNADPVKQRHTYALNFSNALVH